MDSRGILGEARVYLEIRADDRRADLLAGFLSKLNGKGWTFVNENARGTFPEQERRVGVMERAGLLSFFVEYRRVTAFLDNVTQLSLASNDVRVQDESVLESSVAYRANFARYDAALESLVTTQRRGGLVSFPAPVASVLRVGVLGGIFPSLSSVWFVRQARVRYLSPDRFAILLRLLYVLRQQHRRQ